MHKLIAIFLLFMNLNIQAQSNLNSLDDVDKTSYEQYIQKDFKALKATVKSALENNIDFYYLRMRIGILSYDKKNYENAIPHFKKALEFYPDDSLAKQYLYYAYVFSAQQEIANEFAAKQDISFQQKVGYKCNPFDFVGISVGTIISNDVKKNKNNSYVNALPNVGKAERTLNNNIFYGEFFFQNTIKNRLHLNNSLSVFNINPIQQIELKSPFNTTKYNKERKNVSIQYNFGLSYITKKQWTISLGFGFYQVKGNTFTAGSRDTITNEIPILESSTKLNSYLGSITISKRLKYVEPYLQLSASNLNLSTQIQGELGLTYYPLGNYNFYGVTSGAFLKNGTNKQYVIKQRIGFKITKWFWTELNFMYGNLSNYNIQNGFTTYNTLDAIKLNTGVNFNFYATKHFQINLGYDLQQRERFTEQSEIKFGQTIPTQTYQSTKYFSHSIKTSLIWNF
jgi:tetratricopeptide (TPR) repeat protein